MCQLKKIKFIAVVMAMSVLFMPMLSILETKQNLNVVQAQDTTVSTAFFEAVVVMLGITAYMQGNMSSTFSIPEANLITLKDQFAQTLEADATKKAAWMNAQADYLAGGTAKTMGAVELAKIGVNDIYNEFNNYIKGSVDITANPTSNVNSEVTTANYKRNIQMSNITKYLNFNTSTVYSYPYVTNSGNVKIADWTTDEWISTADIIFNEQYLDLSGNLIVAISAGESGGRRHVTVQYVNFTNSLINNTVYNELKKMGLDITTAFPTLTKSYTGYINYNPAEKNIINTTANSISVLPTIPWVDSTIPAGTIVTPALSSPYAGTVPIDVPITVPIDPPIDDPDTPSYPDVLSATLAILAALTPISAILDNIDLGIGDLSDVIDVGNTAISDGIGDIIDSITGSVTDIGTIVEPITSSLDKFFDPPSKDIDWDKLKNIQIFDKFPFSIPADLYFLLSLLASDPSAPKVSIDLDLSFIGAGVNTYSYDLSQFDNFAQVLRSFELLAFVLFLLYSSKNMIWK